jgi:hypothetical protein
MASLVLLDDLREPFGLVADLSGDLVALVRLRCLDLSVLELLLR